MLLTISILIIVFLSGCLGGLLNSLVNNPKKRPANMLPKKEVLDREYRDWQISILYIRTP